MTKAAPQAEQRRAMLRIMFTFVKIAVAIYIGLLAGLYFCQRTLEYLPVSVSSGTPKQSGVGEMSVVTFKTPDDLSLTGWFAPPKEKNGRVVLLLHGQGINISFNRLKARQFLDAGYGMFLCEYRGSGGNPGSPTEEGLYNDARGAMRWLKERGYDAPKVVLYGESLGTGVAIQMGTEFPVAAVVLEAPYSSAVEIAALRYPYFPIRWLMKDPLDSVSKVRNVKAPLLVIHGQIDGYIPIEFGRKLFDAAKEPKTFIAVKDAGHPPDLYEHGAGKMIIDWLDKQGKAK